MTTYDFPLKGDLFAGQLGDMSDSDGLVAILNQLDSEHASVTTEELHVYADGTSGLDSNDGLTSSTPKKTLGAVFALVPDHVKHNTAIHLSGTFENMGTVRLASYIDANVNLIIDGGDSVTVIDDNAGSNYAGDISSISSIGLSTAGWTVDEHAGYIVEVVSGAGGTTGEQRLIHGNTSTTITPCINFSADPGAGAIFRIVRPATTFSGGSFQGFYIQTSGTGAVFLQRLYLSGTKSTIVINLSKSEVDLALVVSDSSNAANGSLQSLNGGAYLRLADFGYYDPNSFAFKNTQKGGFSARNASGNVSLWGIRQLSIKGSYFRRLSISNSYIVSFGNGCRVKGGSSALVARESMFGQIAFTDVNSATTKIDGSSGVGLSLVNSFMTIAAAITVSDHGSHGIECDSSRLEMTEAVAGSGNTGAGVRAKNNSTVLITDGKAPTLTGTVGNLSFDGTTQASTWAAIDGGTPAIETTADLVVAKEV
jgi:hypothetical protein